jgi:hypothetical protein
MKANIKKLKQLRRLIKNIPAKNIALDWFVSKEHSTSYKKCVYCPAAWLTTDAFVGKGLILDTDGNGSIIDKKGREAFEAMGHLLGIKEVVAADLFGPRTHSEDMDVYSSRLNDKKLFLERLNEVIFDIKHGINGF